MEPIISGKNSALILSHPGHELRVLGWLRAVQPLVIVLANGAGSTQQPRIELSRTLIERVGARQAEIFGTWSDRQLYRAMLGQDLNFFRELGESLVKILLEHEIDFVAGDSIEGYNPSHDLCRTLIDHAVARSHNDHRQAIVNYEFPLVGHPAAWSAHPGAFCHRLTPVERNRKLSNILWYARATGGTLLEEVEQAIEKFGEEVLAEEWFSPSASSRDLTRFEQHPPDYELRGIQQVKAGHYQQVIRFRDHFLPINNSL